MNLFILDFDPHEAAKYHNDTHVSKMLLEACQILCTAHHVINPDQYEVPYKIAHLNHPCTIWVRTSRGNHLWALSLAANLSLEYTHRTGKTHKCAAVVEWLTDNFNRLRWSKLNRTDFPLAMPDLYKTDCPVQSYRNYYRGEKRGFWRKNKKTGFSIWYPYTYTKSPKPVWLQDINFNIGPHQLAS